MDTRETYRQKYEALLNEWQAKMDAMKANAEKLSAQAKLDMKPKMDVARQKFERAGSELRRIAGSTEDKWNDVAGDVDRAWEDFKAAAEGAYDALRKHDRH